MRDMCGWIHGRGIQAGSSCQVKALTLRCIGLGLQNRRRRELAWEPML